MFVQIAIVSQTNGTNSRVLIAAIIGSKGNVGCVEVWVSGNGLHRTTLVDRQWEEERDFSASLAMFSEALAIRRALADQDGANRARQLDLSWSLMAIGDVLEAKGDFPDALASCREALEVRRQLAAADPNNNGLQCDLAASLIRIGEMLEKQADLASACVSYREALEIAHELCEREPGTAQWRGDLAALQERVDTLARRLEAVGRAPSAKAQGTLISGPT
jgi:tetratricopeptide (TPR) repeat protein